jgi:hypothetical protein
MNFKWLFSGSAEEGDLKVDIEVKEDIVEEKVSLFDVAMKKALRSERERIIKTQFIKEIIPGYEEQYKKYVDKHSYTTYWKTEYSEEFPLLNKYKRDLYGGGYGVSEPEEVITLTELTNFLVNKLEELDEENGKTS